MPSLLDELEAEARAEMGSQGGPITRDDLARALGVPRQTAAPDHSGLPDGWKWNAQRTHLLGPVYGGLQDVLTPDEFNARVQHSINLQDDAQDRVERLNEKMGPRVGAFVSGAASSMDATRRLLGVSTPDDSANVDKLAQASASLDPSFTGDVTRGVGGLVADIPLILAGAPLAEAAGGLLKLTKARAALASVAGKPLAKLVTKAIPVAAASQPLAVREGVNAEGGADNKLAAYLTETIIPSAFSKTGVERALLGGDHKVITAGMKAAAVRLLREVGMEAGEEATTELTHALHEYATGADPNALNVDALLRRMAVAGTVGAAAGGAFNAPDAITQAQTPVSVSQPTSAITRADMDAALAHVPEGGDPAATIKAGPPDLDTQQRDAMRAALIAAGRETPPSTAGLDPAADDAPMPPADPLLDFTPTEVGRLARADVSTPATVGMDEAPTGPVVDPEATGSTVPVSDAEDFSRFLSERGLKPEAHAALSAQSHDIIETPPEVASRYDIGPSEIAGKGVIAAAGAEQDIPLMIGGRRTSAGKYVNHAARPNSTVQLRGNEVVMVPRAGVKPGTELTVSYRQASRIAAEHGRRLAADPVRTQTAPAPTAPAPAPVQPTEDHVARHRLLAAELGRWQDKGALARGEGKAGSDRAANAKKNARGVQKLIDALEGRMSPQELAQVRPQAAPELAPAPAQAPRPATKAPATAATTPSEAAPRQSGGKQPQRASAAPPAQPSQPAATPIAAAKPAAAPADAWTPFPASSDTLGIPRSSMPQVAGDKRGALANYLRARGITWEDAEVAPKDLLPSQAEFNPAKVAAAAKSLAKDGDPARAILVSSDNRIIDGHHQALAMQQADPDAPVRVIRIGAPAREAIAAINAFPSTEQAAGATAPANSPALPGPQDTPLGRVMTSSTDTVKLSGLTAEARAQLLVDARMLSQLAKSGTKTANKARLLVKSLERIAQVEADAQAKANQSAVASPPTPNSEDQPHADRLPNDDRRTSGVPERADQAPAAPVTVDRGTAGRDNGTERQRTGAEPEPRREPGNADRSDRGGRDGVHGSEQGGRSAVPVSDLGEKDQARGDTKPSQDERLVALLHRGEAVEMRPGDSMSMLVQGYVEDRIPAFSVEGKLVRDEHDAAALFAALRSPYVERLSVLVVEQDGTVRRSAIHSVGSIVGADIPTTLADMEAVTGPLRTGDTVYWSHNHPSGDPKPSRDDVAVYRRMETIVEQRGASFRGIVTNGRSFYYFASGTATPIPRQYDNAKPYEAVRFDDRAPLVVNGPAGAAKAVRLVQTNADAVVIYVLTARARVQAVRVYATAPSPEVVEQEVRANGGVQAIVSTGDADQANELARTMHAAPTVKDIILVGAEATSYRVEARFTPGREPKVKDAVGSKLAGSAMDERVEYGAEPREDEDGGVTDPVQTDAEQEQTDSAAMQAPAEPINDAPPAPPAAGGTMARMADAINAQPTGALGFLSPLVGTVKLANGAAQWWSQPLVERVERQAGEHGKTVATMARHANDRVRQLLGQASSILTPTLKLMSGRSTAARAAVRNLRTVEWSADGKYGFARFQDLVENADSLEQLAPAERAMVEKYRALVDLTGQWAENAQFKVYTGENPDGTPTWLLFQRTPDGRKFIRRATQELHDLMQRPGSPEFEQMANALADANGMERPKVFQRLRDESEQAIILRQPLESTRWLKRFPTHIRINGRIVPLLESDPYMAAQHIVRGTAMRVGYVEQFGQDVATAATPSEHPAVKAWVHAGGDPAAFIDLSRALNGMPVDQSPRLAPGSPEYDLTRTIKMVLGIIRTGLLSKAAIVNVPESLGNTLAFVGGKRWVAAWWDLATQPRVAAIEMARMGARTEDVANLMGQEGRKRESLERIIRDVGLRVTLFQGVNEVNELHAALAGLHFAKDLAAGRTSGIDAERLRLLGFNDDEVVKMMSRTAPPALLEAVATRMTEATQGSTSLPSERAKAAHNRAWNLLVAFDGYGQMKLNRLARVHRAMLDAVREKNPDKLLNAAKIAAGFYAGTAASGTVALFLAALAMGGASGLKQLWEQADDHPVDLAGDALRYAMLGGAAASVVNAASAAADGGDQFAEALTRMSLPVSLVQEIAELANGAGRYRDQDTDEKVVTFLRSHLPINRPIATLAAAIGVAYSDPGREAAMSAYWKWRRENTRMVTTFGQDETEDEAHTRFRVAMRRAVTDLRAGKDPSTHLAEALAAKSEQPHEKGKPKPLSAVVAAIKARRLLGTLKDEERAAVTKEIGPTATAKLEAWDQVLTEWAERMKAGGTGTSEAPR